MRSRRFAHFLSVGLAIIALFAVPLSAVKAASKAEVIHSFGDGDGEYPATDLVIDGAGNIYGTTTQGGVWGSGTVFKLTPSGNGWTESVLYDFTSGADGGQPYNGVTLDAQGNLYGTAVVGGTGNACEGGCGVVYKLTNSGGSWSQSVLYNFTGGDDGSGPGAGLTFDSTGNLYGMTPTGGALGLGVIYQLTPGPNDNWSQSVIHTFTGGNDGATGSGGRLLLDGGNLCGVATVGGAHGKGTVFKLTPTNGNWKLRTLYAFKGQPDARLPYGALIRDASGDLYGTTYYEGAYGYGAVYRLSPAPNGKKECSTASRAEQTEPIPSATSISMRMATCTARRARAAPRDAPAARSSSSLPSATAGGKRAWCTASEALRTEPMPTTEWWLARGGPSTVRP